MARIKWQGSARQGRSITGEEARERSGDLQGWRFTVTAREGADEGVWFVTGYASSGYAHVEFLRTVKAKTSDLALMRAAVAMKGCVEAMEYGS